MAPNWDEIIKIAYFTWHGILVLVYTPIIIYYCWQLWKLNGKISSFGKRYPKYVILYCLAVLVHMLVLRPIGDMPRIMDFLYYNDYTINYLVRLTFYNTIHAVYIMALTRAWLLFIEYNKANHLLDISWQQQIIDVTKPDYKLHWTLRCTLLRYISQSFLYILYILHTLICVMLKV